MALQLSSHSFGPIPLPAVPPGSTPAHVAFEIAAGGVPFSIVGFYINAYTSSAGPCGRVTIELERINGAGVIAPVFVLADGVSFSPQDLVISYGSVLSTAGSLSFHAIQWPAASGTGCEVKLEGTLTYLADSAAALTVAVTPV